MLLLFLFAVVKPYLLVDIFYVFNLILSSVFEENFVYLEIDFLFSLIIFYFSFSFPRFFFCWKLFFFQSSIFNCNFEFTFSEHLLFCFGQFHSNMVLSVFCVVFAIDALIQMPNVTNHLKNTWKRFISCTAPSSLLDFINNPLFYKKPQIFLHLM